MPHRGSQEGDECFQRAGRPLLTVPFLLPCTHPRPKPNRTGFLPDPGHQRHSRTVEMIAEPSSLHISRKAVVRKVRGALGLPREGVWRKSHDRSPRPLLARRTEARGALHPGVHRSAPPARSRRGGGRKGLWKGAGETPELARSAHAGSSEPEVPQRIRPDPGFGEPRVGAESKQSLE